MVGNGYPCTGLNRGTPRRVAGKRRQCVYGALTLVALEREVRRGGRAAPCTEPRRRRTARRRRWSRVKPGIVLSSLTITTSPSTKKSARASPVQPAPDEGLDGQRLHALAGAARRSGPARPAASRPPCTWPRSRTSRTRPRPAGSPREPRRSGRRCRAPSTRPRSPCRRLDDHQRVMAERLDQRRAQLVRAPARGRSRPRSRAEPA